MSHPVMIPHAGGPGFFEGEREEAEEEHLAVDPRILWRHTSSCPDPCGVRNRRRLQRDGRRIDQPQSWALRSFGMHSQ